MDSLVGENDSLGQIRSGIKRKFSILREGWNTWEFWALILAITLLLYILIFYTIPVLAEERTYTPSEQSYGYTEIHGDLTDSGGDLVLSCTPSGDYANTDNSFTCEFGFYNTTQDKLTRFSEDQADNVSGTIIWYYWLESDSDREEVSRGSNVISSDHIHDEGSYYTIYGEFRIDTPSSSGEYRLSVLFGNKSKSPFVFPQNINIYSDTQVASLQYRETIAPLEELVTIGLLLAIFRLIVELAERIEQKVSNREP